MQTNSQNNQRIIITNNPRVKTFYEEDRTGFKNRYTLRFLDSRDAVFEEVRNLIHSNWKLLNHAMAGNIPLHKHPYRSMALEQRTELDTNSLILWESAMERVKRGKTPPYPDDVLEDFQELDYNLFSGSLVR
ncbi:MULTISPECIES: GrdX family protein [unclassified Treponema]|uniref:GrdX family protein n=1 Tax=unclassified Treponema TaxID=2638727 RepID=UPI0020A3124C|nr:MULTISPECIES: GrdX family protein [unclassified Treponema]UTC68422.1 GrdX family protein [Treponema sp. OMZ 789]UTC68565.1 GrdX family protein [Treponema sp. OMZ 790]UTC71295.1 GrdX family protein [Treponema sp. OMZ 791]